MECFVVDGIPFRELNGAFLVNVGQTGYPPSLIAPLAWSNYYELLSNEGFAWESNSTMIVLPVTLQDLGEAFAAINFARTIDKLRSADLTLLPDLTPLGGVQRGSSAAPVVIAALLTCGKRLAAVGNFVGAIGAFEAVRELDQKDPLITERIGLLRAAPSRKGISWRISLQDLQRHFGVCCRTQGCECYSHYELARCLNIFEQEWNPEFDACGTPAFIVGVYHSWSLSTVWSKVIRRIKLDYEADLIPFAARVAADFMRERTELAQSADVLVPVPPSPGKYGKRGFAPADLMAAEIGRVLALPCRMALGRKLGVSTREATYAELFSQFQLEDSQARSLRGRNVVLVDDVVTSGRTVSVCVQKLQPLEPLSIQVVALAKGTRV